MPYATARDSTRLYYEEAGTGSPILFLHEFAADYASWEPQMRYFSRRHRCIAYSARGYAPSEVPAADAFTYEHFFLEAATASPLLNRTSLRHSRSAESNDGKDELYGESCGTEKLFDFGHREL